MKVYVVKAPKGEYEDYQEPIVKVFIDKKKAKQYVKDENAKLPLKQADMCLSVFLSGITAQLRINKSHSVAIGMNIEIVEGISNTTIFKHYLWKNMRWKNNESVCKRIAKRLYRMSFLPRYKSKCWYG